MVYLLSMEEYIVELSGRCSKNFNLCHVFRIY